MEDDHLSLCHWCYRKKIISPIIVSRPLIHCGKNKRHHWKDYKTYEKSLEKCGKNI